MAEQKELSSLMTSPGDGRTIRACSLDDIEKMVASDLSDVDNRPGERGTSKAAWQPRPVLLVALAVAATVAVAWWAVPDGSRPAGQQASMGPVRKLLQSPELTELLLVQARKVDLDAQQLSQAELHTGVRKLMDDFGSFVDENLDARSRDSLQSANFDPAIFSHLRKMFYVMRDPQLLRLGADAARVMGNASATPEDVERMVRGLNSTEVAKLQAEAVPPEVLAALRDRQNRRARIELGFSPAALAHVRHPGRSPQHAEWNLRLRELGLPDGHAHQGLQQAGRRLSLGLTIGIITVSVDALIECLVQLQIFCEGFVVPTWLWGMFFLPYIGLGSWGCGMNGLTSSTHVTPAIMCDVFLGSVALNLIEYTIFGAIFLR